MNILLLAHKPFSAEATTQMRDQAEKAGHSFSAPGVDTAESQWERHFAEADALIVRSDKVDATLLARCPQLKVVVRAGAGYDNVDLDAATARGIVVMNTPGQNANAVAELALGLMIFMARGQFTPATGSELQGKRLGVQAYGNVGRLVGTKAAALGMTVFATDPFLDAEAIRRGRAEPVSSVEALYSRSDYLSIHIPATPQTVGSIGYDLITKLPQGATLINTARKEVMDEAGLLRALTERTDLKYATDTMPDNYAALQEACGLRVFATSKKMGAQTAEANRNAGLAAVRQIAGFFATGNTAFQVNRSTSK